MQRRRTCIISPTASLHARGCGPITCNGAHACNDNGNVNHRVMNVVFLCGAAAGESGEGDYILFSASETV